MPLLPLLALALAAPPAPASPPERAQLLAELGAACEVRKGKLSDIDLVDYAGMLVAALRPDRVCRGQNRRLALDLARSVAEAPSPASGGAYGLLAAFYKGGAGIKADAGLSGFYRRRAWLLGSRYLNPFRTSAEARAFLVQDDTIRLLRDRLARDAPPKERVWLAEAFLARRAPGDMAEARALLRTPEALTEPSARIALARLALEPGADASDLADAAMRLRPVMPAFADGATARSLVLRLGRAQLASARTPEERWDAIQSLAAAAFAGEPEPAKAFRRALLEANGGREPASVSATAPRPRILAEDYPVWAMKKKVSGTVRLRALVDPRGRIVFTEPVGSAQPQPLVEIVRRIYASRSVAPLEIAGRPTLYVWAAIPAFDFKISD